MAAPVDRYAVNRLVQELFSTPENLELLRTDRALLYERYGLSGSQRAALDSGEPAALTEAGLHPILQMHFAMATNPEIAKLVSVRTFLDGAE
jgi:hypothetical protein